MPLAIHFLAAFPIKPRAERSRAVNRLLPYPRPLEAFTDAGREPISSSQNLPEEGPHNGSACLKDRLDLTKDPIHA